MKKNLLIIFGSILLIVGPILGFVFSVEALKSDFNRLADSGNSSPVALSNSMAHCSLWTIAGVIVGFVGLTLLIVGLVKKNPAKP